MLRNKVLIVLVILCLLAGAVYWNSLHKPTPPSEPIVTAIKQEGVKTDKKIEAIQKKVKKEVTDLRVSVAEDIDTLSLSGVADALNAELASFRLGICPSRVDE